MNVLQWTGGVLMLLGALLSVTAALGMVVLPDVAARLQAATKPQILGLLLIVLGAAPFLPWAAALTLLALAAVLQMVTAPVLAQLVAHAAHRAGALRADRLVLDELAAQEPGDDDADGPDATGSKDLKR